jgi:hypothetical protein
MNRVVEETERIVNWRNAVGVDCLRGVCGIKWDGWQSRIWPMKDLKAAVEKKWCRSRRIVCKSGAVEEGSVRIVFETEPQYVEGRRCGNQADGENEMGSEKRS